MALLLAVLAWLQYTWVGQLSANERERLRRHVDNQADNLTEEFNREITRAYFWLQFGSELRRDAPLEPDVDRYARWYTAAQRPELVRVIYRVSAPADEKGTWQLERFARDPARLEPAEWPAELAPIRAALEKAHAQRSNLTGPPVRVSPAWAGIPAILIPRLVEVDNHNGGRMLSFAPASGYTIAVLDAAYLKADLLPQLVERHFVLSQDPSVYVGIYGPGFAFTAPGTQAPPALQSSPDIRENDMFEVRFGEFRRFVRFDTVTTAATDGRPPAGGGPGPLPMPPPGPRDMRGVVNVFRGPGGPGGADDAPRWHVHVLYRAGSLDAVVAQVRTRNLLVSFGVLLLLGASMGLVLVTTGRARHLAAQQMEFVAGVSHELRTPLAVIRSAAENLADGVVEDPRQVKRYGDVIAGEGRRLTHMVEQIMEFAGFESGRVSLDVRPAGIEGIVEDALRAAEPHVRDHHATIDRRLTPALPPVLVDAAAVSRSLQNLIVNALKYGGAPPAVVIEARPGDPAKREVLVTVSDNGAGIAARDLPHIFEPFYRGGDAAARQIHGSGLGLSLVKRIMDEIGGRITVRTDAGKGSAFTLHLPLAPEGAREAGHAGALADPRATTT